MVKIQVALEDRKHQAEMDDGEIADYQEEVPKESTQAQIEAIKIWELVVAQQYVYT